MESWLTSWNQIKSSEAPVLPLLAMMGLAGLDFAGAICAKEWTSRQQTWLLLVGGTTFIMLFALYTMILKTAELSLVTIGWVVFLQVGLLLVDQFRYGLSLSREKWLAVVAILILQIYLVLGPNERGSN